MNYGHNPVTRSQSPSLGVILFFAVSILLSGYFAFAAIQGNYGLFRRVEIQAEADALHADLQRLTGEIAETENLTRRLSDDYLDLDLLDEKGDQTHGYSEESLEAMSRLLELKLQDFGVTAEVVSVLPGPVAISAFSAAFFSAPIREDEMPVSIS